MLRFATSSLLSCLIALVILPVAEAGGPRGGRKVTKPMKVRGGGAVHGVPLGVAAPWSASGTATHLGRYEASGEVIIYGTLDDIDPNQATVLLFENAAESIFIAANGDEIHFDFVGEITFFPDGTTLWVADFTPIEGSGTGRLTRICGGVFCMTARGGQIAQDGSIPFRWRGLGELEFCYGSRQRR